MWCNIGQIVIQIVLILLFHSFGIKTMVIVYTVFTILWLVVWQINAKRLIGVTFANVFADTVPFMLSAAAVMAATYFVTSFIDEPKILLPSRIVVAAVLYFAVMKMAKVKILDECMAFIHKKRH